MEKPCERCKTVTMIDDESRLCYDCWVDLDFLATELESQARLENESEHVRDKTYTRNTTGMDDEDSV